MDIRNIIFDNVSLLYTFLTHCICIKFKSISFFIPFIIILFHRKYFLKKRREEVKNFINSKLPNIFKEN